MSKVNKTPAISIIVPTYNSARNITLFLKSLRQSSCKDFEVIINDDKRTNDDTKDSLKQFKDLSIKYLQKNTMMAQARKKGAEYASGDILIHLDSDMRVTPDLLDECIQKIKSGYDGLVIPEESIGTTFWAKCKWLEKKMYEGVSEIESLRVIKRTIYEEIGGHDPAMVFSEDKDFDLRARETGARIGRISNWLLHDEEALKLSKTLSKKRFYSNTANVFAKKHPQAYRWQANPFNRYLIFIKNFKYLFSHPILYAGVWFMKTAEYGVVALVMIFHKFIYK